jgi:2-phosphosulfolactate phosphatase
MDAEIPSGNVVVVIDVIRAFTTAAVAFERGALEIACAPSLAAGRALRRRMPDHLLVGESRGLKPADYDFGNSPFEMSTAPLTGRRLIQSTSNGTVGLARCPDPAALLAVSARNVGATARWMATHHARTPWTVICTGRTTEDRACAEYLQGLLEGTEPPPAGLLAGVLAGAAEHARSYARRAPANRVDLAVDLPFCCGLDRSDFAMVGEIHDDHVVLTKVPAGTRSSSAATTQV